MSPRLPEFISGGDEAWMNTPGRPCASPIDSPLHIRQHSDNWYPRERYYDQAAKQCAGCPVINQCLQYALDNQEEHGVWGGTTPRDRARLMRKNRVTA